MPDIERAAFSGKDTITGPEWATLSTTSMEQQAVEEFLEAHGWDPEVTLNNLSIFRFAAGDIWSGFVASDSTLHKFVETAEGSNRERLMRSCQTGESVTSA